jgi:hypothetical protein
MYIYFSVHAKFMKLGMHAPHIIPVLLTKLHTQFQHGLAVIPFLRSIMFEF